MKAENNNYIRAKNLVRINSCALFALIFTLAYQIGFAQIKSPAANSINRLVKSGVWISDNGDGSFTNPIIDADYSDPDVIRVCDDYYLVASSFSNFPGLPILHSKDLVNWKIIGYAVIKYPIDQFSKPQHGGGIWAPSIRFNNGEFYIYFGDPDYGIFMTKAKNAAGPWEPIHLVKKAKGWIDPCPLLDDDGSNYLVHAWARSRSGIKHVITINKLSADGKTILDEGQTVFCDSINQNTIEGPKFYKRNGYYYIFAPAGGVKPGWQTILRSKNIYGPYEAKIVLEQGSTKINGPHQGGWVQTLTGEDWFIHFQDRYAFGRVVHLQPMQWHNDWPVMGVDYDKNGIGEPVTVYKKPNVEKTFPIVYPQTSDEFNHEKLSYQWQWESNFKNGWYSLKASKGKLRLFSIPLLPEDKNLSSVASIVAQKFPSRNFSVVAKVEFKPKSIGEKTGLLILGMNYSYIGIEKANNGYKIIQSNCINAYSASNEKIIESIDSKTGNLFLKAEIRQEDENASIPKAICKFSYSKNGTDFQTLGQEFIVKEGRWVGAKVGLFASAPSKIVNVGFSNFDWFRFSQ